MGINQISAGCDVQLICRKHEMILFLYNTHAVGQDEREVLSSDTSNLAHEIKRVKATCGEKKDVRT